ncbi:MAG: hypothetical protein ACLQMT_00255 [Candidatus Acidiferrales bacterium]
MRTTKSFTIEAEISEYVTNTRGEASASERVNELLRRAIIEEQYEKLEAEAAAFFADTRTERAETRAFQKAALGTFERD